MRIIFLILYILSFCFANQKEESNFALSQFYTGDLNVVNANIGFFSLNSFVSSKPLLGFVKSIRAFAQNPNRSGVLFIAEMFSAAKGNFEYENFGYKSYSKEKQAVVYNKSGITIDILNMLFSLYISKYSNINHKPFISNFGIVLGGYEINVAPHTLKEISKNTSDIYGCYTGSITKDFTCGGILQFQVLRPNYLISSELLVLVPIIYKTYIEVYQKNSKFFEIVKLALYRNFGINVHFNASANKVFMNRVGLGLELFINIIYPKLYDKKDEKREYNKSIIGNSLKLIEQMSVIGIKLNVSYMI